MKDKKFFISGPVLVLIIANIFISGCSRESKPAERMAAAAGEIRVSEIKSMENGSKWSRCFRGPDGYLYFRDSLVSTDGGKTLVRQNKLNLNTINGAPERAVLSYGKKLYALDGPTEYAGRGVYRGRAWSSGSNMDTLIAETPVFYIPDGALPIKDINEWYGLFVYRTILIMPDSTWLMTMYGNFINDTIKPYDTDAARETRYMQRTFIVTSSDEGKSWHFLSNVAVPSKGDPVGEGFVEPAITRLSDGRLLCVMRAGHHYPLYSSWSSDSGRTWSAPVYTGLDRGCDPCLITLSDGRVALSWGRRFPEGWSEVSTEGDKGRFVYPGKGYTNLALSSDGGKSWDNHKIIMEAGSCYTTIIETEPGLVFMQADQWYCTIDLRKDQ